VDMVTLMGPKAILVGLQPGVVSALVDMDLTLDGLLTALNLEDALRLLDLENRASQNLGIQTTDVPCK